MFGSALVLTSCGSRLRKVLRAEERVGLHPEPRRHPSHRCRRALHLRLSVLTPAKLLQPRIVGAGRSLGTHLIEGDFGLAGLEKAVQSRHVRGFVWSLMLGESPEVWGAGRGGHASVVGGAWGSHAHPHASRLEAHGCVEAIGDLGPHGAHHGAGGGEGRYG